MITVNEVKEKKRQAEAAIAAILIDLEKDTGCTVVKLEPGRGHLMHAVRGTPSIQQVLISLELPE
jgi:hypothetical protein